MAEVVYAKVKGVQKDNQIVNLDEFIAVKGIKALGNQLTTDKIKQINILESLPYEEILDEPEAMVSEESNSESQDFNIELDDDGQITLSLE
jgi:topoisomerase-4 subunit A